MRNNALKVLKNSKENKKIFQDYNLPISTLETISLDLPLISCGFCWSKKQRIGIAD
jgi:hypothetical protein